MRLQDRPWYYGIPRYSMIFYDIPLYSMTLQDRPWYYDIPRSSMIFHDIALYSMMLQDRPWYYDIPRIPRYSMIFRGIPLYSTTLQHRPWYYDIPRYSTIFYELFHYIQKCSKTDHDVVIFHTIPRYSMIFRYIPGSPDNGKYKQASKSEWPCGVWEEPSRLTEHREILVRERVWVITWNVRGAPQAQAREQVLNDQWECGRSPPRLTWHR